MIPTSIRRRSGATVILWIQCQQREYKQFVAARIAKIISLSKPSEWRWLPAKANVADDATRANSPPKCNVSSRWIQGPDFLKKHVKFWPLQTTLTMDKPLPEEKPRSVLFLKHQQPSLLDFKKFSSYKRLQRVIGWVLRFAKNSRKNQLRMSRELTASEMAQAEERICIQEQQEFDANDIMELHAKGRVTKNSSLHELTPYLDDKGLLSVAGRIDNAFCLSISARRPIILPRSSHDPYFIMSYYHQKNHHQNDNLVVNDMRQKF